jgi:RNA polymerase sigma-70 factor, ECF subfamily
LIVLAGHEPSTAELVIRTGRGDALACDQLVRRHLRAAYAIALAVLGRPADAEDTAQDAFVTALERLDDCREPARFSGWLRQIVRNHALHALERRKVREPDGRASEIGNYVSEGDAMLRSRILERLATLSMIQREIILLHDLDGWTHAELATALGITEVNCRQHLFIARRTLRAELSPLVLSEMDHAARP